MAVPMQEPSQENSTDRYPLLLEPQQNIGNEDHVIDIERSSEVSAPGLSHNGSTLPHREERSSNGDQHPITQSPPSSSNANGSNARSPSITRRGERNGRHNWTPFNTILWLSIELVFTLGQIIAAVIVLSVSRSENPQTPLFAWIVGYAAGCGASIPILYWRYLHRNQGNEHRSTQSHQDTSQGNSTSEPNSYLTISLAHDTEEENGQNTSSGIQNSQATGVPNARIAALMDHLKMALDCFFAVWFVVGNIWIFGGQSSSSDAPNLYRLSIVFLTFSCIGYAMPFILCSMICCCMPCIISFLGVRDDMNLMRGATDETINALPTHKFKSKGKGNRSSEYCNSGVDEGGFVASGTEKERVISGEDAVCCICLASYADNDELRELPCSHFFHTECVDKWLKINASCPLCKLEIGDSNGDSPPATEATQQL